MGTAFALDALRSHWAFGAGRPGQAGFADQAALALRATFARGTAFARKRLGEAFEPHQRPLAPLDLPLGLALDVEQRIRELALGVADHHLELGPRPLEHLPKLCLGAMSLLGETFADLLGDRLGHGHFRFGR